MGTVAHGTRGLEASLLQEDVTHGGLPIHNFAGTDALAVDDNSHTVIRHLREEREAGVMRENCVIAQWDTRGRSE